MGPAHAMEIYVSEHPSAEEYEVILYGSLAATGAGHGTDTAISAVTDKKVSIIFDKETASLSHENTMDIFSVRDGKRYNKMRVMSIGGGDIEIEGRARTAEAEIYTEKNFSEIAEYCKAHEMRLSEFVVMKEGAEIYDFLYNVRRC